MTNHSLRRDRRRFLQESVLATVALAGGMGAQPLVLAASPQQARAAARTAGSKSLSRQFADWVVGLRYEDLPPAVVDRAKGLTLQNIASALLGSQMPAGKQAIDFVTEEEGGAKAGGTIMVSGAKATKGGAAFANAEMMFAGGKWDTFRMLTHPGTVIIPAALVAAENERTSGRDFITAIVAGYEVMERMAADWIPTVMARGFHAGPVFSIFGAAIAAAKIMRFDANQVHAVISLCTNLAGANLESRALREGAAVRNAMLAVALAKRGGIGGGEAVLEGPAVSITRSLATTPGS
jgi:2-methylcitrate dehydratase PrpD